MKVAVVTGAGRRGSIGRASVDRLVAAGWNVVASDIGAPLSTHPDYEVAPSSDLAELASDRVLPVACDVTSEQQVEALFATARQHFGRVDAAINCAGLGIGLTPVVDLVLADWQVNIDVMATGAFLVAREAARVLVDQGEGGRIVTISSQSGKTGMPLLTAYCAAKFAVIGLTQSMAAELGPSGITVNAICPGVIDTPLLTVKGGLYEKYAGAAGITAEEYERRLTKLIPLRRLGTPSDIAEGVAFLLSDAAAFITGEALNITGGQEMH